MIIKKNVAFLDYYICWHCQTKCIIDKILKSYDFFKRKYIDFIAYFTL